MIRLLPTGETGNRFTHEIDTGLTLNTLFTQLGVQGEQRLLTILNGAVIQPEDYANTPLNDNDELSLMPPIAAG